MKKQKNRALEMLKSDRLGINIGAEEVIKQDIEKLLNEYFFLKNHPKVFLEGSGDKVEIKIEAEARSVKKFYLLK